MAEKSIFAFDTSELEATVRQITAHNGKDLARALNKKMGWLLRRWLWNTPKADSAKAIRELGLQLKNYQAGEKKTKSGKVIKFKGGWKVKGAATNSATLPMIIRMISRRKGGSPFKGKSRAEGARSMTRAISKRTKGRLRSIGYLKSAIASAQKPFLPFSSGAAGSVPPTDTSKNLKPTGRPKGFGTLATEGIRMMAVAVDKSTTKRQQDKGLMKFALPALQKAYRDELADTQKYLNDTLYDTARKLGVSAKR